MFTLSDEPIDSEGLRKSMQTASAGALVVFEGHVRDQNEGRSVTRLDYEGAAELAGNEFGKIADEVMQKFDITQIRCVHRVGTLAIGDVAVWIGVTAPHRGAAFDACRMVIEELKARLPIWKKEFYTDGDSGWLNSP